MAMKPVCFHTTPEPHHLQHSQLGVCEGLHPDFDLNAGSNVHLEEQEHLGEREKLG